jgi:hypothetical protein
MGAFAALDSAEKQPYRAENLNVERRTRVRRRQGKRRQRVNTGCCQAGIGVGVEFIGISQEATRAIEHEVELYASKRNQPKMKKKGRPSPIAKERRAN